MTLKGISQRSLKTNFINLSFTIFNKHSLTYDVDSDRVIHHLFMKTTIYILNMKSLWILIEYVISTLYVCVFVILQYKL